MPNYQPIIPPELQSDEEKKLLAERERWEVKLTYHKHRIKALKHEEAQLERKARNHRIFTRGGMLESFLLKPSLLTDDQLYSLLKESFHKADVNKMLNHMIEEAEKRIGERRSYGQMHLRYPMQGR
jgi:predicted nuclease with TOPRIM domain